MTHAAETQLEEQRRAALYFSDRADALARQVDERNAKIRELEALAAENAKALRVAVAKEQESEALADALIRAECAEESEKRMEQWLKDAQEHARKLEAELVSAKGLAGGLELRAEEEWKAAADGWRASAGRWEETAQKANKQTMETKAEARVRAFAGWVERRWGDVLLVYRDELCQLMGWPKGGPYAPQLQGVSRWWETDVRNVQPESSQAALPPSAALLRERAQEIDRLVEEKAALVKERDELKADNEQLRAGSIRAHDAEHALTKQRDRLQATIEAMLSACDAKDVRIKELSERFTTLQMSADRICVQGPGQVHTVDFALDTIAKARRHDEAIKLLRDHDYEVDTLVEAVADVIQKHAFWYQRTVLFGHPTGCWSQLDYDAATSAMLEFRKSGGDWTEKPTHAAMACLNAVTYRLPQQSHEPGTREALREACRLIFGRAAEIWERSDEARAGYEALLVGAGDRANATAATESGCLRYLIAAGISNGVAP